MSTGTNAFWREVLDYIPGLVMLFRIDEEEQAHLIFVSDGVTEQLGFEPEQYVLASEEPTMVRSDLENLVDRIASMTHPDSGEIEAAVNLTDRGGNILPYQFDYRLFRPKSSKVNLISVALHPVDVSIDDVQVVGGGPVVESGGSTNGDAGQNKREGVKSQGELAGHGIAGGVSFVAGSPVMKGLMKQVDELSRLSQNMLITGERSTGKMTIADIMARKAAVLKSGTQVWSLDLRDLKGNRNRIFAGLDEADLKSTILDDIESNLQLVLGEISLLKAADQRDLLLAIETRLKRGFTTRVIATTTGSAEDLQKRGKLSVDFLYRLSFLSVMVPPLRDRADDLQKLAELQVEKVCTVLGVGVLPVDGAFVKGLMRSKLPGNFEELNKVVAVSVLGSSDVLKFSTGLKVEVASSGSEVGAIQFAEILPFEEMSRLYLEAVLERTGGRIYGKGGAAEVLEMKPTTLQSKLKKLEVKK
ncbi:MAG TPA: hypothetical protein DCE78_04570 [Bacteroidetes bacterium]|nr:hypothetical protein [Bacteroidota bacterium]